MLKFGTLEMRGNACLAPMAGVTDHVMRVLCREYGAAWTVTEMINAQGFCCAPENQAAIERLLLHTPEEGPVGVQLFGRDPVYFAEAARRLEDRGFAFIDLNMGCPARKVVAGGSGSALMKEPALCGRIVSAVRGAVRLPVTVKMRSGWDAQSINAPLVARICAESGADAVAIHGRTREMQYSGQADRSVMRAVKEAVQVPVIANGDLRTAEDVRSVLAQTGCDGVMIGRGACGNPWAFQAANEGTDPVLSPQDRIEGAIRHLRMLCEWLGEAWGVIESRKHIAWYLYGLRGAAALRARIMGLKTRAEVEQALRAFSEPSAQSSPSL